MNEKRKADMQELYQHIRMLAYYSLIPHLTKSAKNKPIDEIIPDIYEPKKEKPSDRETYDKLIEKYKRAGLLN